MKSLPPLRCVAALTLALLIHPAHAAEIGGFVTRAGTPERFFINEKEVHCIPGKTKLRVVIPGTELEEQAVCRQWVVGEGLVVRGAKDKGVLTAKQMEVDQPVPLKVDGFALVDRIPAPVDAGSGSVRADGYPLSITPKTKLIFAEGMTKQPATNQWVRYEGTLHPDGTVEAHSLSFTPNTVPGLEKSLRKKTEFDATAVKEQDRQSEAGKFFRGLNAKKIPAWNDEAMQSRIAVIGQKLVPRFQSEMPDTDPTKIHFRFQLVDEPDQRDGLTLTSGIILVPYQVVQALPSDAELAAVLASDIAEVMEEQAVRVVPGSRALTAANVAGTAADFFVPFLGSGVSLATGMTQDKWRERLEQQSTRSALAWMEEAGYDIRKAPLAWWRLADKKGKPLDEVGMPRRSQYAYYILSTAWRGKPSGDVR